MIMILFEALSAGTKTYYVGQIDMLLHLHCETPYQWVVWKYVVQYGLLPFPSKMIRTESSTNSHLAHCNAYWSTASHKSDKFLSQSTLHGSLYFRPFEIRSLNLELGMIEGHQ